MTVDMGDAVPDEARVGDGASAAPVTANRVARDLRNMIIEGDFEPGDRLVDGKIAALFGVSRNTVRDAAKQLVSSGLIVSRPNAGFQVKVFTEQDVRDIYAARRTLELSGVRASVTASREQLLQLQSAIVAAKQSVPADSIKGQITASLEFHRGLVAFNNSARLDEFFENLAAQVRLLFAVQPRNWEFRAQWMERDALIADLILSGKREEAVVELTNYLADAEASVIDFTRAAMNRKHQI